MAKDFCKRTQFSLRRTRFPRRPPSLTAPSVVSAVLLICAVAVCNAGASEHSGKTTRRGAGSDSALGFLSGVAGTYTDSWAVQLDYSALSVVNEMSTSRRADLLASKYGLVNMGQIGNLNGYYHFRLTERFNISRLGDVSLAATGQLLNISGLESLGSASQTLPTFFHRLTHALSKDQSVGSVEQQQLIRRYHRRYAPPTDPKWSQQWSLRNVRQTLGPPTLDLNVQPAWMQGLTGEGVVVSFIDDGLEKDHPDLRANYDTEASRDLVHHDSDPTPDRSYDGADPDRHGTNCAGIVGMVKSNSNCGVGVAYNAKIGGIKVRLNQISDLTEASALGYHDNHIHVYSSSWGPSDSGFVVSGPGRLASMSLRNGALNGRDGKGAVYVWAAGNGGLNYDSCAADGFTSSIYTISIGSADENGREATFDEQCSSKMAVTYSYNSYTFPTPSDSWTAYRQVTTTSLNGECKDDFTGTSASAPLAAGVVALTLQANSNLTWRDVQYLIAYTSNPTSLVGGDWTRNGAGLSISHKFGFGAIDAEAMVTRARRWINVPQQLTEVFQGLPSSGTARQGQPFTATFDVNSNSSIEFLEHTVITLSVKVTGYTESFDISDYNSLDRSDSERVKAWLENEHPRRGDIKVLLTSPLGTTSVLLPFRKHDFVNAEGYSSWPLMSVHYWGENPFGRWTLTVLFNSSQGTAEVSGVKMDLFGTDEVPEAVRRIPTQCHPQCSRGCSGDGPQNCDVCRNLRMADTLECITVCPPGTAVSDDRHGYCLEWSSPSGNNSGHILESSTEGAAVSQTTSSQTVKDISKSVVAGGVAGFIAVILVVILAVLLCVLAYVVFGKRPFRYKIFSEDTSQNDVESRASSLSLNSNGTCTEYLPPVDQEMT